MKVYKGISESLQKVKCFFGFHEFWWKDIKWFPERGCNKCDFHQQYNGKRWEDLDIPHVSEDSERDC
ncbi:MAG: hypothetical protein DRQ47_10930 [Gammaproteobacteria bacterium]|nr:MAG: hypothetical protein DRQ47_10930 [Gammaproteobacteria bacterium]